MHITDYWVMVEEKCGTAFNHRTDNMATAELDNGKLAGPLTIDVG